ncbi:MAG: SurA N-terminal domain-containing protein [Eubacteriales bacterium]
MNKKVIISIAAVFVITGVVIVSLYIRNAVIQEKYEQALSEGVAMFINNEAVYKSELDNVLVPMYGNYTGDELDEKRADVIHNLIDKKLLVQIADDKNIAVTDEEVEEMFNTNMNAAKQDEESWNFILNEIKKSGMTLDEYYDKSRDVYKMTLKIQNLINETFEKGVKKGIYSESYTHSMINDIVKKDLVDEKKKKSDIVYLMDEYKPT